MRFDFETFLVLIITALVRDSLQICNRYDNRREQEIESLIEIISDNLKYFSEHPRSTIVDIVMGVLITRTNVQTVVDKLLYNPSRSSKRVIEKLESLIYLCDKIVEDFRWKSRDNNNSQIAILVPDIWKAYAEDLKYGALDLEENDIVFPDLNSCPALSEYLYGDQFPFDYCVELLLNLQCFVPSFCLSNMTDIDIYHGYQTTHRLLFLQVATRLHCDERYPRFYGNSRTMKRALCREILQESIMIEKRKYTLPTRDLFMEQIALCGLEGFTEFAQSKWRKQIRSWRTKEGCLGFTDQEKQEKLDCLTDKKFVGRLESRKMRRKRTDTVLENGCHSHMNSVGISALSFHLRFLLLDYSCN